MLNLSLNCAMVTNGPLTEPLASGTAVSAYMGLSRLTPFRSTTYENTLLYNFKGDSKQILLGELNSATISQPASFLYNL
jgi:hypothetical protein